MSEDIEIFVRDMEEIQTNLHRYITEIEQTSGEELKSYLNFIKLKRFNEGQIPRFISFLRNNSEILESGDFLEDLHNNILALRSEVLSNPVRNTHALDKMINRIDYFNNEFSILKNGVSAVKQSHDLIETTIKPKINELQDKIKDVEALRLALEQRETNKIYLDLYKKYHNEYITNNIYFFGTIISTIIITLFTTTEIINFPQFSDYKVERNFWIMFITTKILIATVALTFCTLFLRRLAHAKKLKEQAYQTHVEINAFPIHVRSLKDEDKHELIKELALKYFGKELDQTQNDKIGELMQEQLSAGTELVRASAELVRAKSESGGNEENKA